MTVNSQRAMAFFEVHINAISMGPVSLCRCSFSLISSFSWGVNRTLMGHDIPADIRPAGVYMISKKSYDVWYKLNSDWFLQWQYLEGIECEGYVGQLHLERMRSTDIEVLKNETNSLIPWNRFQLVWRWTPPPWRSYPVLSAPWRCSPYASSWPYRSTPSPTRSIHESWSPSTRTHPPVADPIHHPFRTIKLYIYINSKHDHH